ncbi:MAG: peptidoglycan bridge formation glycyltransferase FemA/FemB family protein [Planctomycetota bacterium]|nr:peptidoglycan bridge formation glycyltransferase FemA/FemB family protein [Planctomycetota bacterium]
MSSETQVQTASKQDWLALAPTFRDYNYRHIWDYGLRLAQKRGAECQHVIICRDGEVIGLADVRLKRTPVIGSGIAYISGGPLTRRGRSDDAECLRGVLQAIVREYVLQQGFVLRVLAPLGPRQWNTRAAEQFRQLGFRTTKRSAAYRTLVVDIGKPLSEVRASLAQKWRNCLNSVQRKGLAIREGADDATFEEFCTLFNAFNRRKGFVVDLDASFYRELQREMSNSDRFVVTLAENEGKVVAGHVFSMLGDTCVYLLGATNEEGLKTKAAYLLQWNAIAKAQSQGLSWYDLGGIDPNGNPSVYHFKSGMGGEDLACAGPFQRDSCTWRSALTLTAEALYRAFCGKAAHGQR